MQGRIVVIGIAAPRINGKFGKAVPIMADVPEKGLTTAEQKTCTEFAGVLAELYRKEMKE